jgi:caa(3)-type oxidase subunit IV
MPMHSDHAEVRQHIKTYLTVGGALLVLTGVTVAAASLPGGVATHVTIALIIAALKGSMVAAIFMHLNHEKMWVYGSLALTAAFFVVLMMLPGFTTADGFGTPTGAASRSAAPEPGHAGH